MARFGCAGCTARATSLAVGAHTVCTAIIVYPVRSNARVVKDKVWASGIRASGRLDALAAVRPRGQASA